MGLNEAMERAALAWLADRVTEVGQVVSQRLAGDLADWLAEMPSVDRHGSQATMVDDCRQWNTNATQPRPGAMVEIKHSDGVLWRGVWEGRWSVDFLSSWRYI